MNRIYTISSSAGTQACTTGKQGIMSTLHTDLESYYTERADGYDAVYEQAAQQADLAILRERVPAALQGHNVLELISRRIGLPPRRTRGGFSIESMPVTAARLGGSLALPEQKLEGDNCENAFVAVPFLRRMTVCVSCCPKWSGWRAVWTTSSGATK